MFYIERLFFYNCKYFVWKFFINERKIIIDKGDCLFLVYKIVGVLIGWIILIFLIFDIGYMFYIVIYIIKLFYFFIFYKWIFVLNIILV